MSHKKHVHILSRHCKKPKIIFATTGTTDSPIPGGCRLRMLYTELSRQLPYSGTCLMGFLVFTHINMGVGDRGSTVVKVLCYKSEGRWFDPSWCHWNFSLIFRSHYGHGVDTASNRNEYQEYFLVVKAAGA